MQMLQTMNFPDKFDSRSEQTQVNQTTGTRSSSLLQDFMVAIGLLIGISLAVRLLIHVFVPGM